MPLVRPPGRKWGPMAGPVSVSAEEDKQIDAMIAKLPKKGRAVGLACECLWEYAVHE